MYLKRSNIGKFWPIPRKGTKYLANPSHDGSKGISLLVAMRNILKLVKNKKELKSLLREKTLKVNHKLIIDCNYPLCFFDIITLERIKKNYQVRLSLNKKIELVEIKDEDAKTKVYKVIGKKILKGKVVQLNLRDGINMISKEKANINDSVVLDLKNKKILRSIPMKKGENAFVFEGKHAGIIGKIEDITQRGGKNIAKIRLDKEKVNVWTKNIIILE